MRYTRPQIISNHPAVSAIQLTKGQPPVEISDFNNLSTNAAYQADE
jgi:hypothetical protein